jgi:hypothetical protein
MGISSFSGNDVVNVRFQLNLTNGKSYSRSSVTGSMTQSYFRSPFSYPLIIGCRFDANNTGSVAGIYTINGQDSYGDGWNGASVDFTVDGVTTVITFASGSDVSKTITVPASASTVGIAFTSGDWDSEVTYQVEWTDLNGANGQTALSDGTSPAVGFKALNICK